MGSPQHLNTTVKGSVGMLQEAAQALRQGGQAAGRADDAHHAARDVAHSEWEGEGAAAFLDHLKPHLNTTRDLEKTCQDYAKAFDDLAGTIESVNNDMRQVLSTAQGGGLEVQGPIVLRPKHPGQGPSAADYQGQAAEWSKAMDAYQAQVDDYNAKAKTFNTCLDIFKKARKKEEQGHTEFWQAVEPKKGFDLNQAWDIGTTTASGALATVAESESARSSLFAKISGLESSSKTYQMLASGQISLSGLTAKQRMQVMNDLARTKGSEVAYRRQLKQLSKIHKYVPEGVSTLAASHPGELAPSSKVGQQIGKTFKRLPWAGSLITASAEVVGAATGEQTWGKAVARTGGMLGGGWLGGAGGATLCAPLFPPYGSIVCGAGGTIAGSFAGAEVVDFAVPEDTDMPKSVDKIDRTDEKSYSGPGYP